MVDFSTRRKFEALVSAAYADGILSEEERMLLRMKARAVNLSDLEFQEILARGEQGRLSVSLPPTPVEREALLDDLIEIAAVDGRVEAPEYHVLARFAQSIRLPLAELRARVNRRLAGTPDPVRDVRRETARTSAQPQPAPMTLADLGSLQPAQAPLPSFSEAAMPAPVSAPPAPPGPIRLESPFAQDPAVANLPPVTLRLLKQSIMFDNEADSTLYIARTLGASLESAAEVRQAILAAFPDLKPGSQQIRPSSR